VRRRQHALEDLDQPRARGAELRLHAHLAEDRRHLVPSKRPGEELDGDEAARGEVLEEPGVCEGAAAEEADRAVGRGRRGGRGRGRSGKRAEMQGRGSRGRRRGRRLLLRSPVLRDAQVLLEGAWRARAEVSHSENGEEKRTIESIHRSRKMTSFFRPKRVVSRQNSLTSRRRRGKSQVELLSDVHCLLSHLSLPFYLFRAEIQSSKVTHAPWSASAQTWRLCR